jgi:diketogulonate reductase-like aldo/keto reductase
MQMVTAHGAEIPAIGFGTWPMRGEACAAMVAEALRIGYRHIDTAQGYSNEADVGEGIAASGLPAGEIFVTTKVTPERASARDLVKSVEASLGKLRRDQVDLLLVHWPNPRIPVGETIAALCDARRRGLARNIGISNYTIALTEEALRVATEPIVASQVEYHPLVDQTKLLVVLRRHDLAIIAYCPIALGRVVGNPVIEAIARAHGRTAVQVTLRWLIQQGDVAAIPKSSSPARARENFAVFDFALSDAEMAEIATLKRPEHLVNDRALVPAWD